MNKYCPKVPPKAITEAMMDHFRRKRRTRRDFVQSAGISVSSVMPIRMEEPSTASGATADCSTDSASSACTVATEGGNGGESGEESSGGDDDDDPNGLIGAAFEPEWWQLSLFIAFVITVATTLIILAVWKPNRFTLPIIAVSFLTTFGISLYFNPRLWFRRMAELSATGLLACNTLGGLVINVPLAAGPLQLTVPSPHWSMNVILGVMVITFGVMHFANSKRQPRSVG